MAKESSLKDRIVARIRVTGRKAYRLAASPYQKQGLPDILVLMNRPPGRALFLEAKVISERPRRLQTAVMNELANGGAAVAVVYSVDDALEALHQAESMWR